MQLKPLYSARDVTAFTGLTARQLQWWDVRGVFRPAVRPQPTGRGGFTERRYTPIELIELIVLADLRRRGFAVSHLRRLLATLRIRFGARLYDAVEGSGPIALYADAVTVYLRTASGTYIDLLGRPDQPLLSVEGRRLRPLTARLPGRRRPRARSRTRRA